MDPGGDRSDSPARTGKAATIRDEFLPIQSVSLFIQLMLALFVVASIVGLLTALPYRAELLGIGGGPAPLTGDVYLLEDRYNVAFLLVTGAYLGTSITFLAWFWRMYSNLTFLGRPRRRSPGWAVGGWFIPFAGMVIPYGIGAEIWTQSKPQSEPVAEMRDPNMEPVISWWALFLLMSLVNVVQSFMLREGYDAADLAAYVGVDMVASVVAIAAAIAAFRFVRLTTDRQERLLALRQAGVETAD